MPRTQAQDYKDEHAVWVKQFDGRKVTKKELDSVGRRQRCLEGARQKNGCGGLFFVNEKTKPSGHYLEKIKDEEKCRQLKR